MTRYNPPSHEIYEFPTLIDDPTRKRIIVEVTENPAGIFNQILFCIDTEVVDVNTDSIAIDDETIFGNYLFLHPIAGLKTKHIYSELPSMATLERNEIERKSKNEYQKLWIRKKREKHIQPVMCKQCEQFFLPKRSTAAFCSSKCRLQCHRAKKSPAPSSVKVLEVLFDPDREDRYKGRSVEWFKAWGSQMCLSTADKTDKDIKELVEFASIFKKDENWKKYYPDLSWEDFCLEVFKKPSAWIDHWLNNFKK